MDCGADRAGSSHRHASAVGGADRDADADTIANTDGDAVADNDREYEMKKHLVLVPIAMLCAALLAPPALADTPLPGGGGGGKNIVIATNQTNGRLTVRANLQLNRIPGPNVQPVNLASATSSCTDCQTLVVALQLNIASTSAAVVVPQNSAVATNAGCLRCVTVARAIQYLFTVPDPLSGDPLVLDPLLAAMQRTLTDIQSDPTLDLATAEARLDAVIAEFQAVAPTYGSSRDAMSSP